MAIEREPLQVRVRLEDVRPTKPHVRLLEPGTQVEVIAGTFAGFAGRLVAGAYPERNPFTVVVQEAAD